MLIMTNKQKAVENTPATVTNNLPAVSNEIFEAFQIAKTSDVQEITSEYKTFEEGESEMLCFMGMTSTTFKEGEEPKPAARLMNEQGENFVNADAVVISTLSRISENEIPCIVTITCTGSKKSAKGTYSTFSIKKHG
jgi:hypothetical protein